MKKVFLFFTAMSAIALSSCSSDSDSGSSKLLSKLTVNESGDIAVYDFTYDSSHRVATMTRTETPDVDVFTFAYDGSSNRVASVTETGDDTGITTFTYDSNHRLASYTQDGTTTPIAYSSGTYTVGTAQFTLNSRDDFGTVFLSDLFTFNYDTSKKGAFANVKTNMQLLGIFLNDETFLFTGSKKPLDTIVATTGDDYTFTNTYDSDGYATATSVIYGADPELTAQYLYTE